MSLDELSPVPRGDEENELSTGQLYLRLIGVVEDGSAMMASQSEKAILSVKDAGKVSVKKEEEKPVEPSTILPPPVNSTPPSSSENAEKTIHKKPFSVFTNDSIDLEPLITSGVSLFPSPDR